jgi:hypothetical protein
MFERFTDRARRVVVLAQEEARLLNHNYIGTEHMLLGLIHEGDGVAARALEAQGIRLDDVRREVEGIIGRGDEVPVGHIPFTPRAKKVLELSLRESMQLGHNYIGTEHVLLGLIREEEGVAAQVLVKLGANLAGVRQRVLQILAGKPPEGTGATLGNVVRRPAMNPTSNACVLCNRDLWETDRYVTGALGSVCEDCLRAGGAALDAAGKTHGELMMPPRIFGEEPENAATAAIVHAFRTVFGGPMWRSDPAIAELIEDGVALMPFLAQAGERHAAIQIVGARVAAIRYLGTDEANVRYAIHLGQMPQPMPFEGLAVHRDGRWLVSRETMVQHLTLAGVHVPPADPTN